MINRKKIIAGNWKMNKTQAEARVLVADIIQEIGRFDQAEIVLCPPFTALAVVSELLNPVSNIRLGAQNLHEAPSGAFTGEISAGMLRELYVRYVIIGHSERNIFTRTTPPSIARPRLRSPPSCAPSSVLAKRCPNASPTSGKKCSKRR
jgi:triosephosphate isomerase